MVGFRAVIGLSLLCALAWSAISATSAVAETKTATGFACHRKVEKGGAGFSKAHCTEADAVGSEAEYQHDAIIPGEFNAITGSTEKTSTETTASTNAVLKVTVGGLKVTLTATKMTTVGEQENFEDPSTKAMDIKGRKTVITFEPVTVTGAGFGGCKVNTGKIVTNNLVATSLVNTMEAEYQPEAGLGKPILTFEFQGCSECLTCNSKPFNVTGSYKAIASGATLETTVTSTEGKGVLSENKGLWSGSQKATLTRKSAQRLSGGDPLSYTTVVDP